MPLKSGRTRSTLVGLRLHLNVSVARRPGRLRGAGGHLRATGRRRRAEAGVDDIPADLLPIYRSAGEQYGVPWSVLAAIGKSSRTTGAPTSPASERGTRRLAPGRCSSHPAALRHVARLRRRRRRQRRPQPLRPRRRDPERRELPEGQRRRRQPAATPIWHYNHSQSYVDPVLKLAADYADGGDGDGAPGDGGGHRDRVRRRDPGFLAVRSGKPVPAAPSGRSRTLSDVAAPAIVRRDADPGPRGPRARAQAPGHVHRRHEHAGAAPPGLGGRRQRGRRGAGRVLHRDRRDARRRRRRHGRRRRPRHPGRHPPRDGRLGARAGVHAAACGRQVRRRPVQGLRRPARRRRVGHQRPVRLARGRGAPRRPRLPPALRARHEDVRGDEACASSRGARSRARPSAGSTTSRSSRRAPTTRRPPSRRG